MPDSETTPTVGVVRAIAYRPVDSDPMHEIKVCRVLTDRGLEIENRTDGRRNVTLLSKESWADTCRDLGKAIPWWTRRANLLVEGLNLCAAIGKILQVGPIRLHIHDETRPCKLMDAQHKGLTKALVPDCRGGVFGQVLNDGTLKVGDEVRLVDSGIRKDGVH